MSHQMYYQEDATRYLLKSTCYILDILFRYSYSVMPFLHYLPRPNDSFIYIYIYLYIYVYIYAICCSLFDNCCFGWRLFMASWFIESVLTHRLSLQSIENGKSLSVFTTVYADILTALGIRRFVKITVMRKLESLTGDWNLVWMVKRNWLLTILSSVQATQLCFQQQTSGLWSYWAYANVRSTHDIQLNITELQKLHYEIA